MAKVKGSCNCCGKIFIDSKLMSIPGVSGKFCGFCRKKKIREIKELRFKALEEEDKKNSNNVSKINKKFIRLLKFNPNYLTRDEEAFLKSKNCNISDLKKNLRKTNFEIVNNKKNKIKEIKEKKKINDKFKESFNNLK